MTATLSPTTAKNAISGKNTLVGYRAHGQTPEASWTTIPGVFDGNEITITIHHYTGDSTQQALIAAANSGNIVDICLQYSDETTAVMEVALKSAIPQDANISETIKWDIVGKLNGKPTWTFGSGT